MSQTARTRWRVANGLFFFAFLASAAVQLNDPDPIRWVLVYLAAASGCIGWERGHDARVMLWSVSAISAIWSFGVLLSVPAEADIGRAVTEWSMSADGSEPVREVGGLWLVCGWTTTLALVRRGR